MNKIILIGNLVKEIELSEYKGTPVANGTLAVNRTYSKDKVDFIPFTIWGVSAEVTANNNGKGSKLMIEGELQINKVNEKFFTKVNVKEVEFLSPKSAIKKDIMGNPFFDNETPVATKFEEPEFDFTPKKFSVPEDDLPF